MNELDKLLEDLEAGLVVAGADVAQLTEDEEIAKMEAGIDEALSALEEAEQLEEANKIKFDQKTKLKMAITKKAVLLAKESGDTLFMKYEKAREVKEMAESAIVKKYGMKAKAAVKEALQTK